jgi:cell division transport system ATP-binding protein
MDEIIRMEEIYFTYSNGVKALQNINLSINKGEFVFIVGPTGCGKSTLLKLIYLEEKPTKGRIFVNERNITNLKISQKPYLRRTIGVIFQDFKLLPQKNVWENVAFALEVTNSPKSEIYRQVPKVLELVGLSHKSKYYPEDLSGGEQQRVSIARALVHNPMILLADEPTGNLDPETSKEIVRLLLKINLKGTTVVMATHNKTIVDEMKQRVISMADGKIINDRNKGTYHLE